MTARLPKSFHRDDSNVIPVLLCGLSASRGDQSGLPLNLQLSRFQLIPFPHYGFFITASRSGPFATQPIFIPTSFSIVST